MYYTADASDLAGSAGASIPLGVDHPGGYQPDPGLVDAVNVALVLNRPLLVTGEPGTGKTQLAYSVAWQLASRKLLNVTSSKVEKFETKSTSIARDLFYTFDTLGRFHAATTGGSKNNADYLSYNALGRALINALDHTQVANVLPPGFHHEGRRRTVVVIDEVDKAPRDFPNDLLNEIVQMYFRIPELGGAEVGGEGMLDDDYRPLVFITSNSEKNLPDPFLRRCIYYNIPFPDATRLEAILLARLSQFSVVRGPLVDDALRFFFDLRERGVTRRRISPAELIQWLAYMLTRKASPKQGLKAAAAHARQGISAIAKDPEDLERVRAELERFLDR